jgi:hypothetical protein
MKYVLITSEKIKYFISEQEKNHIFGLIDQKDKFAMIQGDIVPLHITPSVIKFERWFENESKFLALKSKKMCKRCLKLIDLDERCDCGPKHLQLAEKAEHEPISADVLKKSREQVAKKFSWPDKNIPNQTTENEKN